MLKKIIFSILFFIFTITSTVGNVFAYNQQGIASWYGPGFQNKKTANGEKYNMYAMTAASKSLPLGTVVRVTNMTNGSAIVVKINDRGPYVGKRIIDLSYAAAQKIGMIRHGTAKVSIKSI